MAEEPDLKKPRALARFRAMPSVASGRALLPAMLVLLVCDVIGGLVALGAGADTWNDAWGFDTVHTVPLPIGLAQLALALLAARNARPPIGMIAALLLSAFCLRQEGAA
jgi:hypothetical protein